MVVAQLVEWSLPIPEVRGSNPVIGKNLFTFVYCQLCNEKTKIKKKIVVCKIKLKSDTGTLSLKVRSQGVNTLTNFWFTATTAAVVVVEGWSK